MRKTIAFGERSTLGFGEQAGEPEEESVPSPWSEKDGCLGFGREDRPPPRIKGRENAIQPGSLHKVKGNGKKTSQTVDQTRKHENSCADTTKKEGGRYKMRKEILGNRGRDGESGVS